MRNGILFGSAVLLGMMAGCSDVFTIKHSGYTVQTHIGDTVKIDLQGNPSTGYVWQVADFDPEVVRPIGQPTFEPDAEGSETVGGSGIWHFRFQPVATGKTMIKMVYVRPWEQDASPDKAFQLEVEVLPPPEGILN